MKKRRNWTDITRQSGPKPPPYYPTNGVFGLGLLYEKLAPAPLTTHPREWVAGAPCCEKNDIKTARKCQLCDAPICIHCRGLLNGQWICAPCRDEIKLRVDFERATFADFPRAMLGGTAVSVFFGAIWYALAVTTQHEFTLMGLVVGIGVGIGVQVAALGKRGFPIQLAAMLAAIASILVGLFAISIHFYNVGVNSSSQLSVFSLYTITYFVCHLNQFVGFFDLCIMVIAGVVAFIVPRPRVIAVR